MQQVFENLPVGAGTQRVAAAAGIICMIGGSSAVWAFDPSTTHLLPMCPLLALTGFACPGCGLTRAFHALSHGNVLTALDFNALIPIWTFVFGYLFVSLVLTAIRGKGLSWNFATPASLIGLLILMLGFGVLRNLPYYPFNILFP
jgi:drug/metabolite transporter (DMT)-like permease